MDLYDAAVRFPRSLGAPRRVLTSVDIRRVSKDAVARRVKAGRAHRPTNGSYLFGRLEPSLLERTKAALAVSPPGTAVGFHTAAALLGFGVVGSRAIHLVVPDGQPFPQRRGVRTHRCAIPFEPVDVLGVPCTPAARCAVDLARRLPRIEALPVLDAALFAGACQSADLAAEVLLLRGFAGARQARELVALADPRPQCRQESQLRLILHDNRLSGFEPQLLVVDDGAHYYLDLGNRSARVGAEYDGASHLDRANLRRDRRRHNVLESLGWRMRYFTDHDIYYDRAGIIATLRTALARR